MRSCAAELGWAAIDVDHERVAGDELGESMRRPGVDDSDEDPVSVELQRRELDP